MNEETTIPSETSATTLPTEAAATEPAQEETVSFETVETIYEDLPSAEAAETGAAPEETTVTVEVITVEIIETVGSDIVHASLFGSFLVCGTLIGLALLRNIHGT